MIIIVVLSLLLSTVFSAAATDVVLPSTTGNFFYADVLSSSEPFDNAAFHRIEMLLGQDESKQFQFALNSEVGSLQIVGSQCQTCTAPKKYNPEESDGAWKSGAGSSSGSLIYFDNNQLGQVDISSELWNDVFKLQVDQYARQTSFASFIEVITDANPSLDYYWDGNFGFAPYSGTTSTGKYRNMMYILKEKNYIDHNIISLNLRNEFGNSSSVKFGSYDISAISQTFDDQTLFMMNTTSDDKWSVAAKNIVITTTGNVQNDLYTNDAKMEVVFNPALPYIYIGSQMWEDFTQKFNHVLPELLLTCNPTTSICTSQKPCDQLPVLTKNYLRLSLSANGGKMYDIDLNDILISGKSVGASDDKCILGVFQSVKGQVNAWYVGAIGFNDWYFVFDMEQYDEHNAPSPRIGIGWKNDRIDILKEQYDSTYQYYNKQNGDISKVLTKTLDFFKPWVIALLAAFLFVLIVVIYIVVMKTCCKKSDLDDEETIEDIMNTRDLKHIIEDQTLLSQQEIIMERNIAKADRKKAKKGSMGGLDESQHSERSRVLSMND